MNPRFSGSRSVMRRVVDREVWSRQPVQRMRALILERDATKSRVYKPLLAIFFGGLVVIAQHSAVASNRVGQRR